ncbi:hypothetical protein B484DRAFT_480780, partial [Ochromonadaceae sp. CCMP2298]
MEESVEQKEGSEAVGRKDQMATGPLRVPLEVALLVATGISRDVQLSIWFSEASSGGVMTATEFKSRLVSLTTALSIGQSAEISLQLRSAAGAGVLEAVAEACAIESEDGMVSITHFLKDSLEVVDDYVHSLQVPAICGTEEFGGLVGTEEGGGDAGDAGDTGGAGDAGEEAASTSSLGGKKKPTAGVKSPQQLDQMQQLEKPEPVPMPEPVSVSVSVSGEVSISEVAVRVVRASAVRATARTSLTDTLTSATSATSASISAAVRAGQSQSRASPSTSPSRHSRPASAVRRSCPTLTSTGTPRTPGNLGTRHISNELRASAPTTPTAPLTKARVPELGAMRLQVQELVRGVVRRPDCYHPLRVALGISAVELVVPARGAVVAPVRGVRRGRDVDGVGVGVGAGGVRAAGRGVVWLGARDLQQAFRAGGVALSPVQADLLCRLVHEFAEQRGFVLRVQGSVPSSNGGGGSGDNGSGSDAARAKNPALGPSHSLSAAWLQEYLASLRFSRRASHTRAGRAQEGGAEAEMEGMETGQARGHGQGQREEAEPMPWRDWLQLKLQQEAALVAAKPGQFQQALRGEAHSLTRKEVNSLLRRYSVLTPEQLQRAVDVLVRQWLEDADGRRDFLHRLHARLCRWVWAKKTREQLPLPRESKGLWRLWLREPEEQQRRVRSDIAAQLVGEKKTELLLRESKSQGISRDLFWAFQEE